MHKDTSWGFLSRWPSEHGLISGATKWAEVSQRNEAVGSRTSLEEPVMRGPLGKLVL